MSTRSIRMMIMVGPAETECLLPGVLDATSKISPLPILPLRSKEEIARAVAAQFADGSVDQFVRCSKSINIVFEVAGS